MVKILYIKVGKTEIRMKNVVIEEMLSLTQSETV